MGFWHPKKRMVIIIGLRTNYLILI